MTHLNSTTLKNRRKLRGYIAGPIGNGETIENDSEILKNVKNATKVFQLLAAKGHAPFCPHWSQLAVWKFRKLLAGFTHQQWLGIDFSIIRACDYLVLLPGESSGSKHEVEFAGEVGIPMFALMTLDTPEITQLIGDIEDHFLVATQDHGTISTAKDEPVNDEKNPGGTFFGIIDQLTQSDRRDKYGPAEGNFKNIAMVWSGILGVEIDPRMIGPMMCGMKMCRQGNCDQDDNLIDGAAYLKLAFDIQNGEAYCCE